MNPEPAESGKAAPQPQDTGHLKPGDEAPPGAPGTGENVCRNCGGTGTVDGQPCPECEGTGTVVTGVGGA